MSVGYNVHLGPYLHIPWECTSSTIDLCGHEAGGSKFCPECGRDQSDRFRHRQVMPAVALITESIMNGDNRLTMAHEGDGFTTMISNMTNLKERPAYDQYSHVAVHFDIPGIDCDEESAAFANNFADEIASIKTVEPLAEIRWGLLMWTS